MNHPQFDYDEAFSRNIGLLSQQEQSLLRTYTIAIPGMGGVGGIHLISLVRQGFERFKIADLDVYELKNFNRQYGARLDTLDQSKVEVMRTEALKINPRCIIDVFPSGISPDNIDSFLDGVDLAIDSLDAFAIDERRLFINSAHARKIPVITAGPIGFSTAVLIFLPGGPNFDQFCAINNNMPYQEKLIRFFVGLVPKMLQRSYMQRTNLSEKRGPSSAGAVDLCAGVATIYALKILLKKGSVRAVPYFHQYDVMKERYVCKRLWFGNRNPIQALKIKLAQYLVKD
jgi:molybdopterin/thiamine biosynthesis adenylyltransferase